jgi:hypothetical protein
LLNPTVTGPVELEVQEERLHQLRQVQVDSLGRLAKEVELVAEVLYLLFVIQYLQKQFNTIQVLGFYQTKTTTQQVVDLLTF